MIFFLLPAGSTHSKKNPPEHEHVISTIGNRQLLLSFVAGGHGDKEAKWGGK